MKRRSTRRRSHSGGWAILGGITLICLALTAFGALAYFYLTVPRSPNLSQATLCPATGPQGVHVVLIDTTDDLPETTQQQVTGTLNDLITSLPIYHKIDIRVLDVAGLRSASLFARCNPGNGEGLSELTAAPAIVKKRWVEAFEKPALEAVNHSLKSATEKSSPIMAAIQDIALDQFSAAAVQSIPKSLTVISDMLEFTPYYSQYPKDGDLSYGRYQKSPAYTKFRTDLHGAKVMIRYVQNKSTINRSREHINFWSKWIEDNLGDFASAKTLQGIADAKF